MREILFRAKETFNGEWVEGYYEFGYSAETEEPTHYMWVLNHTEKYGEMFMVIPETVGQYTGLRDCKRTKEYPEGQMIFEGDIVCFHGNLYDGIFSIVFADGCFRLGTKNGYSYTLQNLCSALEVIGNIHDNLELLKGE